MEFMAKINQALQSTLFDKYKYLIATTQKGANDIIISNNEKKLPRKLSAQHKQLLRHVNGCNLEIVRFFGCSPIDAPYKGLIEEQYVLNNLKLNQNLIAIADNPTGMVFIEDENEKIYVLDAAETQEIILIAKDLQEFICDVMFGIKGDFFGDDWPNELKKAGLLLTST